MHVKMEPRLDESACEHAAAKCHGQLMSLHSKGLDIRSPGQLVEVWSDCRSIQEASRSRDKLTYHDNVLTARSGQHLSMDVQLPASSFVHQQTRCIGRHVSDELTAFMKLLF